MTPNHPYLHLLHFAAFQLQPLLQDGHWYWGLTTQLFHVSPDKERKGICQFYNVNLMLKEKFINQ